MPAKRGALSNWPAAEAALRLYPLAASARSWPRFVARIFDLTIHLHAVGGRVSAYSAGLLTWRSVRPGVPSPGWSLRVCSKSSVEGREASGCVNTGCSARTAVGMAHLADALIPLVKNLLLLDAEGKRVAVKYFDDTWCACCWNLASNRTPALCVVCDDSDTAPVCVPRPRARTQAQRRCAAGVREDAVHKNLQGQRPR